ncbi:hypothetical protein [Clostridium sp.]
MEVFAKPAAGGIIIKRESGIDYILIQERCKMNGFYPMHVGALRKFLTIFHKEYKVC